MELKKILLVIADASRALFYIAHGPHNIVEIHSLNDPDARLEDHQMTSKEHDVNTTPYETKNSKKQHVKEVFSKQVVEQIDKILNTLHLDEICIFAPPRFMGLINKDHLKKHIKITEVTKEIVHLHPKDLPGLVAEAGLSFMPS